MSGKNTWGTNNAEKAGTIVKVCNAGKLVIVNGETRTEMPALAQNGFIQQLEKRAVYGRQGNANFLYGLAN